MKMRKIFVLLLTLALLVGVAMPGSMVTSVQAAEYNMPSTRTVTNGIVTVEGNIPENVNLAVKNSLDAIELSDSISADQETFAELDITLYNEDGTEWQPAKGETVYVTLNAAKLGMENGTSFAIQHIHKNDDGTITEEQLGPYVVENGKASFELSSFSYVIVLNNQYKVTDVEYYYPATFNSGNNHWQAIGVYFQEDGTAHLLMGCNQASQYASLTLKSLTVNEQLMPGAKVDKWGNANSLTLKYNNESEENILLNKYTLIADVTIGNNIELDKIINVSLIWTDAHGFDIKGGELEIVFNDGIQKSVYSVNGTVVSTSLGQNTEVKQGNEVIYKIEAKNGSNSTQNITVDVVDVLPADIFDLDTVSYSKDNMGTWTPANVNDLKLFTIESGVVLAKGQTKTYYVKATIKNDAMVNEYKNTARLTKNGKLYRESTATVEIKTPPTGTLTITKNVTKAYENDVLLNDNFTFTVDIPGTSNGDKTFAYTVAKDDTVIQNDGTIKDNGTLSLKAGETAIIKEVPAGGYKVTETSSSDYTTSYKVDDSNKVDGSMAAGTVTPGQTSNVTFTNEYKKHLADLTISKTVGNGVDPNQKFVFNVTNTDGYNAKIVIGANKPVTIKDLPLGVYTVTEDKGWNWRYTPTFTNSMKEVTFTVDNTTGNVSVVNNLESTQWLDGNSWCQNIFKDNGITVNPQISGN